MSSGRHELSPGGTAIDPAASEGAGRDIRSTAAPGNNPFVPCDKVQFCAASHSVSLQHGRGGAEVCQFSKHGPPCQGALVFVLVLSATVPLFLLLFNDAARCHVLFKWWEATVMRRTRAAVQRSQAGPPCAV